MIYHTYRLGFETINVTKLWLSAIGDKVYSPAQLVRDQLKCMGSDLMYWEALAHGRENWQLNVNDGGIFLRVPEEDKDSVDTRVWRLIT